MRLIEIINQQKIGNESLVVAGASMGGLVARYALTYMEAHGMNHNTRLFISYDSPQKGANVPLGLQHFIAAATFPPLSAEPFIAVSILNKPAAKQMLEYHFTQTSGDPGTPNSHPLKSALFNELKNLNGVGYPQNCRRIAVANGNKTAQAQKAFDGSSAIPGMVALFYSLSADLGSHSGDISFVPANPPLTANAYFIYSRQSIFGYPSRGIITSNSKPFDNSPGGFFPYIAEMGNAIQSGFPAASVSIFAPNSSFIPTISSLDINTNDLFYNIAADIDVICKMPFDAFYAPFEDNQEHIDIPTITANWLYDQITSDSWIINNRQFNFGKNTNSYFFKNTIIDAGGKIYVNANTFTDYLDNPIGFRQDPPALGSKFEVLTPICPNGVNIQVKDGGELIIGDNIGNNKGTLKVRSGSSLSLDNNGALTVQPGSKLIIESGAILTIKNNGSLTLNDNGLLLIEQGASLIIKNGGHLIVNENGLVKIEPGARLIYESGAEIQLLGDNAVLEMQGTMEVGPNATFTFTYPNATSGFVRFKTEAQGPNIIAAPTSAITFSGADKNDKVLEVASGWVYPPDMLSRFTLMNGKAELAVEARLNIGCPLSIGNAILKGGGLNVFGQSFVFINNALFDGSGINGYLFYGKNRLSISNSTFRNGFGLRTIGEGVVLNNVIFENNFQGWQGIGVETTSQAYAMPDNRKHRVGDCFFYFALDFLK